MKNIWSTHTLCLDWLHKCMILCNPDLWSYFSFFWSISYFAFNHTGQMAGWLPGAVSQMPCCLTHRRRSACHHLIVLQERLVSFLLPCSWSQAALAQAKGPAVEAGEVLPEAQWAGSGSVFSLLSPCAFPIWQFRFSSRQGRAHNPRPPAPGKSACPLAPAGDDPPVRSSTLHSSRRSSARYFWWRCSCCPLWCVLGRSFKRTFHLAVFSAPKWTGFLSRVIVKSSTMENGSAGHWLSTKLAAVENQV